MPQRTLIAVYIMASGRNGTLYIGVTSELVARVQQHKLGLIEGFTERYGCKCLVWFERHDDMASAIRREKSLKRWLRQWKIDLIERENPRWRDLSEDWFALPPDAITLDPWPGAS
jgi:putative endonuclease